MRFNPRAANNTGRKQRRWRLERPSWLELRPPTRLDRAAELATKDSTRRVPECERLIAKGQASGRINRTVRVAAGAGAAEVRKQVELALEQRAAAAAAALTQLKRAERLHVEWRIAHRVSQLGSLADPTDRPARQPAGQPGWSDCVTLPDWLAACASVRLCVSLAAL